MSSSLSLQAIEPFCRLPDAARAELEAHAREETFPAGRYLFRQHDPPTGYLYVVRDGLVEIVAQAPGGVEMVVDYRRNGSFFGGTPFLTDDPYTAGARTVRQTSCVLVPDAALADLAERYPQLRSHFTRALLSRVRSLYAELVGDQGDARQQVEAYPFQQRLSELMSREVAFCDPRTGVEEVARRLVRTGTGMVLVPDGEGRLRGIVTAHDLVAKVLAGEGGAKATTAAEVMTPEPLSLPPDSYVYEAAALMLRHELRHLPVLAAGEVVGVITLQDLMKSRTQEAMLLAGGIREADSLGELAKIKEKLVVIARGLMRDGRSAVEIMDVLSHLHRCILRRGFDLVQEALLAEGVRPPQVGFCLFLMGSGGRGEMLLDPDQDHGLILEDYPEEQRERVEGYFARLADKLVAAYAAIGYPPCRGDVMASNPLWRGRRQAWQQRLNDWIRVPEPQRVRYSNNFFDFQPLAGDAALCRELRRMVHRLIGEFPPFLYHLMELNFSHKVPLGLLGGFVLEKEGEHQGMVPTKQTGSLFIVDCLRIFSLEQQLEATSTTERLQELVKRKVFSRETAEHLQAAFQAFTYLRLRREIELLERGAEPTHYLDPEELTRNEQDLLKEAFRAAGKLQDSTRRHFGRLVG